MGNSMTYGPVPVPESAQVNTKLHYETNNSKKQTISNNSQLRNSNPIRDADRYSRNGSCRGNGVRTS